MKLADKLRTKVEVNPETGCWNWMASKRADGYGRIMVRGKQERAHRVSYQTHRGPIPGDLSVCHRCDNPRCINPDHLFLGTHAENMVDRNDKGRCVNLRGSAHGSAKLSEADVLAIRASSGVKHAALAKLYGVTPMQISQIRTGKSWAHLSRDTPSHRLLCGEVQNT